MNFLEFLKYIPKLKEKELPGLEAQFKLAPKIRQQFKDKDIVKSNPKKAGVLILLFPDKNNEVNFLLTKRATYKGSHSAQISFPGGKVEKNDATIIDTALREANEEIGIEIKNVKIIRTATENYIPPSNFLVTPVLGYLERTPKFVTNYEVDKIISVSLNDLFDDEKQVLKEITTSYMKNIKVPCYLLNNYIVWGATAMMLSEIKELLKEAIRK